MEPDKIEVEGEAFDEPVPDGESVDMDVFAQLAETFPDEDDDE